MATGPQRSCFGLPASEKIEQQEQKKIDELKKVEDQKKAKKKRLVEEKKKQDELKKKKKKEEKVKKIEAEREVRKSAAMNMITTLEDQKRSLEKTISAKESESLKDGITPEIVAKLEGEIRKCKTQVRTVIATINAQQEIVKTNAPTAFFPESKSSTSTITNSDAGTGRKDSLASSTTNPRKRPPTDDPNASILSSSPKQHKSQPEASRSENINLREIQDLTMFNQEFHSALKQP